MTSNNVASRHAQTQTSPHSPPPPPPPDSEPKRRPGSSPIVTKHSSDKQRPPTRLRACAGWSKASLVAHTPPSETPCTGSDYIYCKKQKANNSKAKQSKANLKQKAKNKTRHNTEGIHIQDHPISGAALGTAGMTLPPASCLEDCSRSGEPRT